MSVLPVAASTSLPQEHYLPQNADLEKELANIPHQKSDLFSHIQKVKQAASPLLINTYIDFPELLLNLDDGSSLKKYDNETLTSKSPLFTNLNALIQKFTVFSQEHDSSSLKPSVEKISQAYQTYIQEVCQKQRSERRDVLKGPSRLFVHMNGKPCCIELSKKDAHKFVSKMQFEKHDELIHFFIKPHELRSEQTQSKPVASTSKASVDCEGDYCKGLNAAYDSSEATSQLLYLEKLGNLFLEKEDFIRAAGLLCSAIAVAKQYQFDKLYQKLLLAKLERIEELYLHKHLGNKAPPDYRGYLAKHRKCLKNIRAKAKSQLDSKVPIEHIQASLTQGFQNLLCELINESIKLIGKKPPTNYAFLGLGSMARKEMSPYSDVDFAILIEKDTPENREYFRKLTRLLELKIINLGETKFPLIKLKHVGDIVMDAKSFTPSGFSMDIGGLSPLGKTGVYELIGTPQILADFQKTDWLQKNDEEIILVNAMTNVSCVLGKATLVKQYEMRIKLSLDKKYNKIRLRQSRAIMLMKRYALELKPRLDQHKINLRGFNVKHELYRLPHTIINALALYHGLTPKSSLDQLEELTSKKVFTSEGSSYLKQALRQIVLWRAQTHLFYKQEKEVLYATRGKEDLSAQGLFPITKEMRGTIQEMYRVLYPLHQAAEAFIEGNQKAFSVSLYSSEIGAINMQYEANLQYFEAETSHTRAVALNPDDNTSLKALEKIKLTLGKAKETRRCAQERLAMLKKKHGDQLHPDVASSLNMLGLAWSDLGDANKALDFHRKSLAMNKKLFGDEHPNVAANLNNVGITLGELGRYAEALKYETLALELRIKTLRDEHPHIILSLNNVGYVLGKLGRHEEARNYKSQALEIRKKILGDEHPDVAISLNNLGMSCMELGRHEEALKCLSQALKLRKKILGDEHPDVATSLNNIGMTLGRLGLHEVALKYRSQALKLRKKILGDEHPHVALNLNSVGISLLALGRHEEAHKYFSQALEIRKKILGDEHPDVAISLNNLGMSLMELGRHEEALNYRSQALELTKKLLGDEHLQVASSLNNVGMSLRALGRHKEALKYLSQALELLKKLLGNEHPDVASSLNNMGTTLRELGRYDEALKYQMMDLELSKKLLGGEHPDVAISLNNVGMSLRALGRHEEALKYLSQALELKKKILGNEHPDVAACLSTVGCALGALGRHEEAIEHTKQALELTKKLLGDEHPVVARSLNNVGMTLGAFGRYEEALKYQIQALELTKKYLGDEHVQVATSLNKVGMTLEKLGRHDEARSNYLQAFMLLRKLLGDEHPHVARSLKNVLRASEELGRHEECIKSFNTMWEWP